MERLKEIFLHKKIEGKYWIYPSHMEGPLLIALLLKQVTCILVYRGDC